MPAFSVPLFAEIVAMWRDYERGILPGPGSRENQNPNLMEAFAVLSGAEATVVEGEKAKAAEQQAHAEAIADLKRQHGVR